MKTFVVNGTKIQANSQVEAIKLFKDSTKDASTSDIAKMISFLSDEYYIKKISPIEFEYRHKLDSSDRGTVSLEMGKLVLYVDGANVNEWKNFEEYKREVSFDDSKTNDSNEVYVNKSGKKFPMTWKPKYGIGTTISYPMRERGGGYQYTLEVIGFEYEAYAYSDIDYSHKYIIKESFGPKQKKDIAYEYYLDRLISDVQRDASKAPDEYKVKLVSNSKELKLTVKDSKTNDVRSEQNLAGMFRWWNNAMRINEDGTVEVRTEDKDDFMNACIDRSYAKYIAVVSPKHDGWVRYKVNDSKMNDYVGSFLMHQTNENTRKLAMQLADLAKADGHNLPLPDAYELIDESFNEKADTLQRFYQWVKHIGWHDSVNDSDQTEVFKEIQSKYPGVKFKNVEFEANDKKNYFSFDIYGNLPDNLDRFDHTKKVSFERFVEYLLKKHGYTSVNVFSDTRRGEMLVNVRARKYFNDSVNNADLATVNELNAIMKYLVEAVVASENFRQKHDLDRIAFDNLIKNISKAQDNVNFILRNIDIVVKK